MSGYDAKTQDEVIQVKSKFTNYYRLAYNKSGKTQLSVIQQPILPATLYLSGRSAGKADQQLQTGLNTVVDDINWALSYSLTKKHLVAGRDQILAVNMKWHDLNGRMTNEAGLYYTLQVDNNLSYNI